MKTEFFGLPGVGKTQLAIKLSSGKKIDIIRINNSIEKYFYFVIFIITRPYSSYIFFLILFKENKHDKNLLLYKLKHLAINILAKEKKGDFYPKCIIDDGIFQLTLSVYERGVEKKDLFWVKKFIKSGYKVYYLEENSETRNERMVRRQRIPRLKVFGEEYTKKWLTIMEENVYVFKEFFESNYNMKTYV